MEYNSVWNDIDLPDFPALNNDLTIDVLIVGGGITGILCAYELKQRNINCIIVEKNKIGRGISNKTTAFLSIHHDLLYQEMIDDIGYDLTKEYFLLNQKAIDKYKCLSKKYNFDFVEEPAVIYTNKDSQIIENEKKILESMGCKCEYVDSLPLNIPVKKGLKIFNQASIHPLKCINELAKELSIYENTEIINIKKNIAYTNKNKITFKNVIIATHYPFIKKNGLYFMKVRQTRSYVCSFESQKIHGTYCSVDDDSLYFRSYKNHLIIGGYDRDSKITCTKKFEEEIKRRFPNVKITNSWSNQDCTSIDQIPYIGKYDTFHKNWYVATGFNLWGFTWAMASSFILADMIERKESYYLVNPSRNFFRKQLFKNLLTTIKNICTLKTPRCSHLGCALKFNDIEMTWECPCHGSRYDKDGHLLNGPAKKDINP